MTVSTVPEHITTGAPHGRLGFRAVPAAGVGHVCFAAGLAGLGLLSLISGDFALAWQPVPAWVPWREGLARISGILLLTGGIGMWWERTAARFALVMTAFLLSWLILLQVPRVAQAPRDVGMWLGFSETLVLVSGGWAIYASLAGVRDWCSAWLASGARLAGILFGGSCLVLGVSHFVFTAATVGMVPSWLPYRLGFAYLTGAGHLAAGTAILLGIIPRLAATLEACMISSIVLLVHVPGVTAAPSSRLQWTMLFVATALAGSAWAIAKSLQSTEWARQA